MKITEIKVTCGKEAVLLIQPKSVQVIVSGKMTELDEKMAALVFKTVAGPADKFIAELLKRKQ